MALGQVGESEGHATPQVPQDAAIATVVLNLQPNGAQTDDGQVTG